MIRIWYVTTSDGPWLPDEWILLEGENGGCSFPTEALGFDGIWGEVKQRFAGFDYKPLIRGGTRERQTSLLGAAAANHRLKLTGPALRSSKI